MNSLCNVGLCFNPFAQQNVFCLGRLALIRPAVFSRSVFAGLSPHRLAPSHGAGLRRPPSVSLVPLHRSGKPTRCLPRSELRSATVGRVFLSAFATQKPHSFPKGKPPLRARFPLGEYASPLFPKAVTVSCWLLRRGRNRASPEFYQSSGGWERSLQSRARQKPEPGIPAKGFLWAQLLRSRQTPFPRRRICRDTVRDFSVF